MPSFHRRICGFLLASLLLAARPASAANIRLQDGTVYSNVAIVHRDAKTLEIRTQYGTTTLPLASVDRIDGVRVAATPTPLAAPPAHTPPAATPAAATPIPPSAAPAPSTTPAPATPDRPPTATPAPHGPLHPLIGEDNPQRQLWLYAAGGLAALGFIVFLISSRRGQSPSSFTAGTPEEDFEFLDENHQPVVIQSNAETTGIELAKTVLQSALHDRASDVHIEPTGNEHRVRFRIDGLMQSRVAFANERGVRLVAALKNLAQTDIAERRKAQDGRFGARSRGEDVDFRVATTPSVHGEKLVVRILDRKAGPRGLDDLGMSEAMRGRFAQTIHSRNGIILVTGPTGSGKTSTLYAALTQLDAQRINLVTIEDPVEYRLAGATQIPVNPRAGVTYESGLRSILRQDPDVILVGEMRDLEAAQIALRSSLTGHLVFSSLHARDAVGTVLRLEEMGIDKSLLGSALFVVLAQRLVRVLCSHCRVAYPCQGEELVEIGIEIPAGQSIYRAGGCRACEGTGYVGRTGVFELLVFDDELRQAVSAGVSEEDLTAFARTKGYRSYREDAAEKVLLGITTVEEALQAI